VLEIEKGQHQKINEIIDISRINGLDLITIDDKNQIHIGPLVTHNGCVKSDLIREFAHCLFQACESVGSPQIRNRGTVVGNIVTASPANDTISALMALDAKVDLLSISGTRTIEMQKFFTGPRRTVLLPGEIISDIFFSALSSTAKSIFLKNALRNAQAISVINVATVLNIQNGIICNVRIALGSVAPTVIRACKAELFLIGKLPNEDMFKQAGDLAAEAINPISDIRASDKYRRNMVAVHVKRALMRAAEEKEEDSGKPVLLWGKESAANKPLTENTLEIDEKSTIDVNINGKQYAIQDAFHKNLLDLIRENALLTGTKEGCGEGECGACTVFMDGVAVLACLIPAPRAHKSDIITIEGIGSENQLHKVQQSFINEGAVQCGYCTPGFVMTAVKMLEENEHPTEQEIKAGITGNLCRCTGYYKIIKAIENAMEG
jgi:carbon-monoxide dehydrogenase medium subunit